MNVIVLAATALLVGFVLALFTVSINSRRAARLRKSRQNGQEKPVKGGLLKTASHLFMGGIMMMFFVGVALGVYATIFRGEPVSTTLDYIMRLAMVVGLGYFVKAFGENIARIVLPYFGARLPGSGNDSNNNDDAGRGNG
jgi:hypothetical protein